MLLAASVFAFLGHKYVQVEDALFESVNEMRVQRGMDPLVKNPWGMDVTNLGPNMAKHEISK